MSRVMTLIISKGERSSTQVKESAIGGITDSSFLVTSRKARLTSRKAGYMDRDTSRFVDTMVRVCTCSLLTFSIFSVK